VRLRVHVRFPCVGGLLFMGVVGCGGNLALTFPQLQAVGEIGEYGTERLRASEACRKSSAAVDAYVQCMEQKGWKFIARGNLYPAPECWSMRAANDPRQMPMADCFDRTNAPPPSANTATGTPGPP
jgi:hypothetical protein